MKNRIIRLKNIGYAAGIVLLMAGGAEAALVFSTDFTGDQYAQNTGDIVFDNGTTLATEEFFGTNNGIGIAGGDLSFNNSTANRFRGAGVWLDTTGYAPGLITVEVDVANFVAGADTDLFFQAYAANGVDASNTVSLDLHAGANGSGGSPTAIGSATISTLGGQQLITSDGADVPFTFTFNGTDDFVGLVFAQSNVPNGSAFASADLDNLTVTTSDAVAVPEPSSFALLGGALACFAGSRRRRRAKAAV